MSTVSTPLFVGPRPVVGCSGRRIPGSTLTTALGFRDAPAEAYFGEYAARVTQAGGLPVNLTLEAPVPELADLLDALVLSGGGDVDPVFYGGAPSPSPELFGVDPARDHYELALIEAMVDREKPVLGVCRGAQLINVALGGTLVDDLPIGTGESHASYAFPREERRHAVHLEPGTLAHGLYGDEVHVNSFHHQCVDRPGGDLVVSGRAADGVPEVIELPGRPVLGVQWHPEALDADPVFAWLVQGARSVTTSREAIA